MADLNRHIEKLVTMLHSPKAGTRYDACEYLRVVPAITPEAIRALQNALNDPDASVAEAAQRALDVQLTPEPSREVPLGSPTAATPRDYLTVALVSILLAQVPPILMCLRVQTCLSWFRYVFDPYSIVDFVAFSLIPPIAAILITRFGGRMAGLITAVVLGLLLGVFWAFAGSLSAIF